jgi:hypothetical protein
MIIGRAVTGRVTPWLVTTAVSPCGAPGPDTGQVSPRRGGGVGPDVLPGLRLQRRNA